MTSSAQGQSLLGAPQHVHWVPTQRQSEDRVPTRTSSSPTRARTASDAREACASASCPGEPSAIAAATMRCRIASRRRNAAACWTRNAYFNFDNCDHASMSLSTPARGITAQGGLPCASSHNVRTQRRLAASACCSSSTSRAKTRRRSACFTALDLWPNDGAPPSRWACVAFAARGASVLFSLAESKRYRRPKSAKSGDPCWPYDCSLTKARHNHPHPRRCLCVPDSSATALAGSGPTASGHSCRSLVPWFRRNWRMQYLALALSTATVWV